MCKRMFHTIKIIQCVRLITACLIGLLAVLLFAGCAIRSFHEVDMDPAITSLRGSLTSKEAIKVVASSIYSYRGAYEYNASGAAYWSNSARITGLHHEVTEFGITLNYTYEDWTSQAERKLYGTRFMTEVRTTHFLPRGQTGRILFDKVKRVGTWAEKGHSGVFLVPEEFMSLSPSDASKRCWLLFVKKENLKKFLAAIEVLCPNLVRSK